MMHGARPATLRGILLVGMWVSISATSALAEVPPTLSDVENGYVRKGMHKAINGYFELNEDVRFRVIGINWCDPSGSGWTCNITMESFGFACLGILNGSWKPYGKDHCSSDKRVLMHRTQEGGWSVEDQ